MNTPIPPVILGDSAVKTISTDNIKFNGTNLGDVGFYGVDPPDQQEQPTPPVQVTTQSNFELIQDIISTLSLYGLYKPITAVPPSGRTITFTNNSTTDGITIYLTVGTPTPVGATLVSTLDQTDVFVWDIPEVVNWSGNFSFWETGKGPAPGSTLVELGLNQKWKGIEDLRDTFDISTVPPGLGDLFQNGPRADAVAYSASQGFTTQQSRGYSVGIELIPPPAPTNPPISLPTYTVYVNTADGNAPLPQNAITYPNDTANDPNNPAGIHKQQTGYAQGNYSINITNVIAIDLP